MSKNKKMLCIMTALLMSTSLMTACQNNAEAPEQDTNSPISSEVEGTREDSEPSENSCTITIQDFCTDEAIEIESGDTVYEVLKKTGVDMGASNGADGVFIDGINGQFAGDEGESSGWVYSVNGERADKAADKYEVQVGDSIVWEYVTE